MKEILLNDGTKLMSFDDVYKQFEPLMKSRVSRWNSAYQYDDLFGFDDLMQLAAIGLLKAYESYDVAKGVLFITWATTQIDSQLLQHHRSRNRKLNRKGSQYTSILSMNYMIQDDEKPMEFQEMITNGEDCINDLIECVALQNALEQLDDDERAYIVENFIFDMNQQYIARHHGTYQVKVQRRIQRGLEKLKTLLAA